MRKKKTLFLLDDVIKTNNVLSVIYVQGFIIYNWL